MRIQTGERLQTWRLGMLYLLAALIQNNNNNNNVLPGWLDVRTNPRNARFSAKNMTGSII